jgi:uncharacterized protein
MDPVVHFEMPAEDRIRMADFYKKVFGWQAQILGEEMGNYVTVMTTATDENGRPKMPGTINGGFYPKKENGPPQYPSIVIAVENIYKSINSVKEAEGEVLGEPMEIPGVGLYVSIKDTEGNMVSMLQPSMR